ncbi:hypothetical protein ACQVPJ_26255 [Bacillus mycoides]|uniref:Uncharacterized protein n=1 Tax=Bacillus cereus VD021 TaxID=1053224 RepID=R8GY63_BACCE|nr:hypothetical protein [Bacillus cereus]EOO65509.1 hypothetical protein IIC_06119 [Bacillus cereus VD021]
MKKITSLILATVIALGVISATDATQSAAKKQLKIDEIMLLSNEAGPGGGAG